MTAEAADIKFNFARALHCVDMKEDATGVRRRILPDFFNGWSTPVSLLASIMLMSRVSGPNGAKNIRGSMRPLGWGATKVVSTPCCAMRLAACRIAECSIEVVMK